jgi:hypothetical protein
MAVFPVIDTIRNLTDADIALLKSYGVTGVSRYIARTSTIGKIMRKDECDRILRSGLALMVNYEQSAGDWQGGAAKGASDGAWARGYVRNTLGLPDTTLIIQSIDTGVSTGQLAIAADYQRAFNDAGGCGPQGVYGPRNVLEHIHSLGLCRVCWEWMGVAGAPSTPVANIRQYRDKPYALPFTYDANKPLTPYYGQITATGQEQDVPFTTDDVNVLREIAKQIVEDVWDHVLPGRFGYPDSPANVYVVDARVAAGGAQSAAEQANAKLDALTVPGGDPAVLAALIRQVVREELDRTRLTG